MSRNPIPPRVPPAANARSPQAPSLQSPRAQAAAAASDAVTQPALTSAAPPKRPAPEGEILARAGTYYRNTRYLMVLLLIAAACWFGYDGWKGWPAENKHIEEVGSQLDAARKADDKTKIEELNRDKLANARPHSASDIQLQKYLAAALPVVAILFLIWALYNSRGAYRLSGTTLNVPGHPPVDLSEIQEIDTNLWDRKGIAYVNYSIPNGQSGRIRLDDFVYDRGPTDQIYDIVMAYVGGTEVAPVTPAEPQA